MKFCTVCGQQIDSNAHFCPKCGAEQKDDLGDLDPKSCSVEDTQQTIRTDLSM